jgi:hypothetical protein
MELRLDSIHWERRETDWLAAAVAGFAAGAILMMLGLFWSHLVEGTPWRNSHRVAAILLGPDALLQSGFSFGIVMTALATHYLLGIGFGLVLGYVLAGLHFEASPQAAMLVGAVFGLALYLLNFFVMSSAFPWFVESRGWATLVMHLVFGVSAAALYWKLQRAPGSR